MDYAELHADVLAEHPEAAEGADDWTIVTALRAYATAHVDYVLNVDSPRYVDQSGEAVEDRFTTFEADRGGVVCGGTSDAFAQLAQAWGYASWNLGLGDYSDGGLHHMQTLVEIEVDGVPVLTLHDPSTNLSYTDAAGAPIDYFDLLTALAARDTSGIGVLEGLADSDNLVGSAETTDIRTYATSSWTVDPSDYTVVEDADGWVVRSPRTLARFEAVIGPWYGPFLVAHGLPEAAIWLELFPHDIYGTDGDALLSRALGVIAGSARIGFEASEGFVVGDQGGTVNQRYLDAGYAVQTWCYGQITVVAVDGGQALQVSWVDGVGGDPEGIFELQAGTTGAVSARVQATDGGDVHVSVTNAAYQVIHEAVVASGDRFYWSDPEAQIWRVTVESASGDVLVDDFAYGGAAEPPEPEDTGSTDTGSVDTGETGDVGETGATPSDVDDTAAVRDQGEPEAADGACGCASPPTPLAGWALLVVAGAGARRRRTERRITP